MSYTDGIFMVRSVSTPEGGGTGDLIIQGAQSAGTPTFGEEYVFPGGATILEFGLEVQVTLGTQATAAPVCALKVGTKAGSGTSGTEIATITPAASAAAGERIISSSSSFPYRVKPGECIVFNRKTAGNGDTGDYFAYCLVRLDGFGGTNSVAPVSRKAA